MMRLTKTGCAPLLLVVLTSTSYRRIIESLPNADRYAFRLDSSNKAALIQP